MSSLPGTGWIHQCQPALDRSSKSSVGEKVSELAERKPQRWPEGSLVHSPGCPSSLAKFVRLHLAPCGEEPVGAAGLSSVHLIHLVSLRTSFPLRPTEGSLCSLRETANRPVGESSFKIKSVAAGSLTPSSTFLHSTPVCGLKRCQASTCAEFSAWDGLPCTDP